MNTVILHRNIELTVPISHQRYRFGHSFTDKSFYKISVNEYPHRLIGLYC